MALSDYTRDLVAQWVGGIADPPSVDARWLALIDDNGDEVVGGSYARQEASLVTTGTDGALETDTTLTYTNMPAVTVESAQLFDAPTGGNPLTAISALSAPKTLTAGASAVLAAGDVTLTIT